MTPPPSPGCILRPRTGARRFSPLPILTQSYHELPIYPVYQWVRLHRLAPFLLPSELMSSADNVDCAQRSSAGNQASTSRNVEQQTYLQQQRLDTYLAEPWGNGNRLVALPYRSVVTEASSSSQSPSLARQTEDLRGVGAWTASQGGK